MEDIFTDYSASEFDKLYGDSTVFIPSTDSVGVLYRDFKTQIFPNAEKILFGGCRGQVILTIAGTNVGKTTKVLNCSLTLAAGGRLIPLIDQKGVQRRVMLIDGENTKSELQTDLKVMMRDWSPIEQMFVEENLLLVCDEFINDEPLNLSNPNHVAAIKQKALEFKPDVIVIDTAAALFSLNNENDNAEVARVVMMPMKALASQTNSLVWIQHHSGKQSEDGNNTNAAYRGRGGSNFGALARTVMTLTAPDKSDKTRVVFSVAKSKGYFQEDVVLRLNRDSRWFTVTNEVLPVVRTCYDDIVELITVEMSTVSIVDQLKGKYSRRAIEDSLALACERGMLCRVRRGYYAPPIAATETTSSYDESGIRGKENDEIQQLHLDQKSEF